MLKVTLLPIFGRVAQLGERLVRNEEVVGSIPITSTIYKPRFGVVFVSIFYPFKSVLAFMLKKAKIYKYRFIIIVRGMCYVQ